MKNTAHIQARILRAVRVVSKFAFLPPTHEIYTQTKSQCGESCRKNRTVIPVKGTQLFTYTAVFTYTATFVVVSPKLVFNIVSYSTAFHA